MAAIPPKFLYENAGAYFRGELDEESCRKFDTILENELERKGLTRESDDWIYWVPLAAGIFCGII
jgi:hypothetical protein